MVKKEKIFNFVLVLILFVTLIVLTGCGQKNEEQVVENTQNNMVENEVVEESPIKNGNETYIDADSGYIFNDTTGDISFYDKNTHSVYNTDSKEFTYLDIRDGYVYNFNTGKTTLVSGSTTLGS